MASIFPSRNEKQIPKSLNECVKKDYTAADLNHWADRIETWGQLLLALLILAGFVLTIIEVVALIDTNESLILPTVITAIITWGLYAFIEYFAYHILALVLRALSLITQHTIITANVALYESQKGCSTTDEIQPNANNDTTKWACPDCGNVLPGDVIRCNCGYKR